MAAGYPQLVLFGDSLFQGSVPVQDGFSFQAALQEKYIRRLDVINRGFSGYNTSNAVKFLEEIFPPPGRAAAKIDYLLILLGANDAVIPLPTTIQHVPIATYKANLTKIVTHPNITAHKPTILLVTPPPLDQIKITTIDLANGHGEATRHAKISAAYSEVVREVVREHEASQKVFLVDLWQAIMDAAAKTEPAFVRKEGGPWLGDPECGLQGGLDTLLPDGLHMSGEAYRIFYGLVKGMIGTECEGLDGEDRTGYVFPDWKVVCAPQE